MKYVCTAIALLLVINLQAQIIIGQTGMSIASATPINLDGLLLTPSASLTIANNSIQRTSSPLADNPSIARLYQLSTPLLFSGRIGIAYLPAELNGYLESSLQIAYAPAPTTTLTVTSSSTLSTTAHSVTNTLTDRSLYVVTATALSDLTPLIYARPTAVYGNSSLTVVVDVEELNSVATRGSLTVKVSKDPKVSLRFDASLTQLNGRSVQNSAWRFEDSDPDYYILTTSQSVAAGDQLSFGLVGSLSPGASSGVLTVSSTVLPTTVREAKLGNNIDADKVEYFQQ